MASSLSLFPPHVKEDGYETSPAKLLGYFGRDNEYGYVKNISQLSYLTASVSDVPLDLSRKFDTKKWQSTRNGDESLCKHLQFYIGHEDVIRDFGRSKLEDVGFLFTKRSFVNIASMLFDRKSIVIYATLFNGAIYVRTKSIENYGISNAARYDHAIGHKFAHCVVSNDPNVLPNIDKTINEAEGFFGIFQTNINKHRIICRSAFGSVFATKGGINSVKIPEDLNEKDTIEELRKRTFIRLKCAFYTSSYSFKKYTTRLFWIESLISTITDFQVGYFNRDYIVDSIKHYTIDDILEMRIEWHPEEFLGFCDALFDFIITSFKMEIEKKNIVIKDDDIRTIPKIGLTFSSENRISIELVASQEDDFYLHDSYIEEISKLL